MLSHLGLPIIVWCISTVCICWTLTVSHCHTVDILFEFSYFLKDDFQLLVFHHNIPGWPKEQLVTSRPAHPQSSQSRESIRVYSTIEYNLIIVWEHCTSSAEPTTKGSDTTERTRLVSYSLKSKSIERIHWNQQNYLENNNFILLCSTLCSPEKEM